MKAVIHDLEDQVHKVLQKLTPHPTSVEVTHSTQPEYGHYQCNNALKLAGQLRKKPQEIARSMISLWETLLKDHPPFIEKLEVAGPGFINIFLDPKFLSASLTEIIHDPRLGVPLPKKKERVIVEFSSPNIAKSLHVGHLRSTIIGDSLARLFEFLGHDVLRLSHIGDWGTQFGMLIAYMREHAKKALEGKEPITIVLLMGWYQAAKKQFDEDPSFKKQAQLQVVKLQGGDEVALATWRTICDVSRQEFEEIYSLLDVHLVERGESFYNPFLPDVVADLEKRQMITLSEGAKCIYLEGYEGRDGKPLPIIIQKSDGGYNYDTTDMAALRQRIEVEKADRIIIVTDMGQALHFEMIFAAAKKAGYLDPTKVRIDHVPFGVVLGPDGKKFKTRSGFTEKLIDLLLEAPKAAAKILKERLPEISEKELLQMASILGIDAIKYADLSSHRIKDYSFSYERMLRFEGNTAPFLLYAYVRMRSIQRKVGKPIDQIIKSHAIVLSHPTEISLGLHLRQFGETLDRVAEELLPNRLADYLYTLAEKFHAFFRDCRVEGSPEEASRLLICELAARILQRGLHILGLKTLERM